jgi:type VI secretion system protein VasI
MGMMFLLVVLCVLLIAAPAVAANDNGTACAKIASDDARLACYDMIFKKSVETSTSADAASAWTARVETSKIDDTKNVFVNANSLETSPNPYGQPTKSWMMITCRENTTSLYINFAGHFMSDLQGKGTVTYRIDKNPAARQSFTESNDHSVLGLWNGGAAIPFIKRLFGANSLLVRATPFSDSAVTAEFSLVGLENALKPLRDACRW